MNLMCDFSGKICEVDYSHEIPKLNTKLKNGGNNNIECTCGFGIGNIISNYTRVV